MKRLFVAIFLFCLFFSALDAYQIYYEPRYQRNDQDYRGYTYDEAYRIWSRPYYYYRYYQPYYYTYPKAYYYYYR